MASASTKTNNPPAAVKFFERQQAKARAAETLREVFEQFPELLDELLAVVRPVAIQPSLFPAGLVGGNHTVPPSAPITRSTAFDRISKLFLENGNEWLDTSELTKQSGINRNVIATVLWSVRRDDFEQQSHPTHKRMKMWRLEPSRYQQLMINKDQ